MKQVETTAGDRWLLWDQRKCKCDCKGTTCLMATQGSGEYGRFLLPVHKTSNALKQWFSKCVHWPISPITGNAHLQAHLRPTEPGLWGGSICFRWFSWGKPCTRRGKCNCDVGGDIHLLVLPQHQPLLYSVIGVFMDTHFPCQLVLKYKLKWRQSHLLQCQSKSSWSDFAERHYAHLQWHHPESFLKDSFDYGRFSSLWSLWTQTDSSQLVHTPSSLCFGFLSRKAALLAQHTLSSFPETHLMFHEPATCS